jgi:hypothetical protein
LKLGKIQQINGFARPQSYKQVVQDEMSPMTHVVRDKNGTYYFRRVIPERMRQFMPGDFQGKANWKKSFLTKSGPVMKRAYAAMQRACERDFNTADLQAKFRYRRELTPVDITALADWYRDILLVEDDHFRTVAYAEDEAFFASVRQQANSSWRDVRT